MWVGVEIQHRCWTSIVLTHMGMCPSHERGREKRKGIVRSKKRQLEEYICPLMSSKSIDID